MPETYTSNRSEAAGNSVINIQQPNVPYVYKSNTGIQITEWLSYDLPVAVLAIFSLI